MPRLHPALPLSLLLLCATGCDNVGRAFDRTIDSGGPAAPTTFSAVQVIQVGGDARDGRPKVRATFPKDGGWPATVPIVVEFSESINEASVLPTTEAGTDGRVILRVKGTTQALPCQYDFFGNGRVLMLRPLTGLSNQQTPTYEVVLLADARDTDGVRFQVDSGGTVLTEFQVNQDEMFTDGRILMTYPRDNSKLVQRESEYFVVFDRPANVPSILATNLFVRPAGGAALSGDSDLPLSIVSVPDSRFVRFTPDDPLAASTRFELVVDDTITFGQDGKLDFRGRTPFAGFETGGPAAPTAVALGNPLMGFPDKINRTNAANVVLHVTTPADAQSGDRVRARIYGGDADTNTTGDLAFVERFADVPQPGAQVVVVDFGGTFGSLTNPKFDDGSVTFAVQLQRGSANSGFVHNARSAEPQFDITQPKLTRAGPPSANNGADILSDTEYLAFYGTASEAIAAASLADGVNVPVSLFASDATGHFLMQPLPVGRLVGPRGYSLLLTDTAGNLAEAAATGSIVQRGLITGLVAGSLTIEAYDATTLLPIPGASVLVDPGAPTLPATGQIVALTDVFGRVTLTGLAGTEHTITIVRAGYDLLTLYQTRSAFVSLPLRPRTNATATLRGTVAFQQAPGTTAVVGSSAVDDRSVLGVRTTNAAPNTIPDTPIIPNRPQVLTAFGGVLEPTAAPTFSLQGYQMFGPTLMVPTPPAAPVAAGEVSQQSLALVTSMGTITQTLGAFPKDFALAQGLDVGNLVGGKPIVRVTLSLNGFEGQVLAGLGSATLVMGATFSVNANFGLTAVAGFALFAPVAWVVTEARDTMGRVSRHRGLLDATTGTVLFFLEAPSIPTVTAPTGPASGSPAVTFADGLDGAVVPGGQGIVEVTAQDSTGRSWVILVVDRDPAGGTDTLQFPDLATANVAGLAAGTWSVRAEARLLISLTASSSDDLMLTERVRQEVLYARSSAVSFTIQ